MSSEGRERSYPPQQDTGCVTPCRKDASITYTTNLLGTYSKGYIYYRTNVMDVESLG